MWLLKTQEELEATPSTDVQETQEELEATPFTEVQEVNLERENEHLRVALSRARAENYRITAQLSQHASLAYLDRKRASRRAKLTSALVALLATLVAKALGFFDAVVLETFTGRVRTFVTRRPRHCTARPYGALVLEGGGVKGVAYGGAAAALEAHGMLKPRRIVAFAGTSAGSMMAALLAAGATSQMIVEVLLSFPFEDLMDGTNAVANLGRLQRQFGWFKGDAIERKMVERLEEIVDRGNVTFAELARMTGRRLRVSVTDVSLGRHAWLDEQATPNVRVAAAVRASSAVPFVYPPVLVDGRLLVDGGLLHNLPSTAFTDADDSLHFAPPTKRNKERARKTPSPATRFLAHVWGRWPPRRRRAVLALSIRGRAHMDPMTVADEVSTVASSWDSWRPDHWRPRRRAVSDGQPALSNIWEFSNRIVATLLWGGDSPNALPDDAPHLDVVAIDTLDVSAADFSLDAPTRAALVAAGWRAVSEHLVECGHARAVEPPEWLVKSLLHHSHTTEPPSLSIISAS